MVKNWGAYQPTNKAGVPMAPKQAAAVEKTIVKLTAPCHHRFAGGGANPNMPPHYIGKECCGGIKVYGAGSQATCLICKQRIWHCGLCRKPLKMSPEQQLRAAEHKAQAEKLLATHKESDEIAEIDAILAAHGSA